MNKVGHFTLVAGAESLKEPPLYSSTLRSMTRRKNTLSPPPFRRGTRLAFSRELRRDQRMPLVEPSHHPGNGEAARGPTGTRQDKKGEEVKKEARGINPVGARKGGN